MLGTPGRPYTGTMNDFITVESSMRARYDIYIYLLQRNINRM